ncbi:T9SS type A sorting domain-containing protein, partial [bacterium]|nr:T9SS type A sorting domain-containing protein [bacterium]
TINRPDMWFPVPGGWAGGSYDFIARVGWNPSTIFDESGFPFTKDGADQAGFQPWVPDGVPNPFDQIIKDGTVQVVDKFELVGAYPNPFNPTTTISYALPTAGSVELSVFDISGREVAKLVDGYRDIGVHNVQFDATGLASGVYLYRLNANGNVAVNKMVLMK